MRYRPPRQTREYFSGILRGILDRGWPLDIVLASTRSSKPLESDPRLRIEGDPRLMVMLEGEHSHAITRSGHRTEYKFKPGDCLYWPGHAWNITLWKKPCVYFGIVYRRTFIRYLMVDFPGGPSPVGNTPWSWHSSQPVGGAALHLLRGLDVLAEEDEPESKPAHQMMLALLHLAEDHLRDSVGNEQSAPSGTWERVLDHLSTGYSDPMLSRDSVAAALKVHPNYLSTLAREKSEGFHRTLEEIRIAHARHLLARSTLKTAEVSTACGYNSVTSFIRAFRRVMGEYPGTFRQRRIKG